MVCEIFKQNEYISPSAHYQFLAFMFKTKQNKTQCSLFFLFLKTDRPESA